MRMSNQQLTVLLNLLLVTNLTMACFITNCPPGGKRSMAITQHGHQRQCIPCAGNGICYGPDICCGPTGCTMRSPGSAICKMERLNPRLCTPPGPSCSAVPTGHCTPNGLCCNTDSCTIDKLCEELQMADSNIVGHWSSD